MDFGRAGGRPVAADFDGGMASSDAGASPLGETDKAIGPTDRFAACFGDGRSPPFTIHAPKALVAQRVFGPLAPTHRKKWLPEQDSNLRPFGQQSRNRKRL